MPRSAEPARRQFLDAALRLWAEQGIRGTSLREIRLEAGQRNANALYYHFGNKEGLLRALLERELPWLVHRREELLAGADDLRSTAAVLVLPFAELATGDDHQRAVVQFLSQLHDDVSYSEEDLVSLIGHTGAAEAFARLRKQVVDVDQELLAERLRIGLSASLHVSAVRAKGARRAHSLGPEGFCTNLVDMFLGALLAPST